MTIIAYRNGVMASDSLITTSQTRTDYIKKVATNKKGWIGGACGDYMALVHYLEWIENGCKKKFVASDKEFSALLMSPDGKLHFLDETRKTELTNSFYAIGSGADIALGAMQFGANAVEAVKVAIALNIHCGGDVHFISKA